MKITAIYPLMPYPMNVMNVCFPAKADSEVGVVTIIKQRLVKTSLKIN